MSSAPGPKEPLQYGDSKIDSLIAFIPSIGDMTFGIAMVSLGDVLSISVIADQSSITDPDGFIEILNKKFREFI